MTSILSALVGRSVSAGDEPLDEIIELGKKALRQKAEEELACDLLGLDGVSLPLKPRRGVD